MTRHMVIAPGEPVDRSWMDGSYSLLWMPQQTFTVFEIADPFEEMPQPLRATLHTYHHPAWKVRLRFYVDNRLGVVNPEIPPGYVLPGSVHGERLESCPLGKWAHHPVAHRWVLEVNDEPGYQISCEVLARGSAWVRERLARENVQPLPPEAQHGCPPRPDAPWTPLTLDELADLLGGDPDDQAP